MSEDAQQNQTCSDVGKTLFFLHHVPVSAAGLIVPEGFMMPFPMPPLDKAWTGCIEYIPGVTRSDRAHGQLRRRQRATARTIR